jgi:anti-anti-sigma regulatory factor
MTNPVEFLYSLCAAEHPVGYVEFAPGRDQIGQCQVLEMAGECDATAYTSLREMLATPWVSRAEVLVVDMTHLTLVDAGCIELLLGATSAQRKVVLVGSSGAVARVLDIVDPARHLVRADPARSASRKARQGTTRYDISGHVRRAPD